MANANDSQDTQTDAPIGAGRRPSAARRRAAAAAAAPAQGADHPGAGTTVVTVDSATRREENPRPTTGQLGSIRNLLAGDQSGAPGDEDHGGAAPLGDEDRRSSVPKDLNALAKQLGVKIDDLYGLKIRFPGSGEDRTLGDLKDWAKTQDEFKARELRFEETRSRKESEFMRAENDVRELFALLPPGAKNVREAIAKRNDARMAAEKNRVLDLLPDWHDDAVRTKEVGVIREFLGSFGFPKEYFDHVGDSRLVKLLRESAFREQRIREVLANVEEDKPGSRPGSKPNGGRAPSQNSAERRTGSGHRNFVRGQVADIHDLLKG